MGRINIHVAKLGFWSICGVVACIPFAINIGNLALILAAVITLFYFQNFEWKSFGDPGVFFPVGMVVLTSLSGLLSDNVSAGIAKLDRQLLIVLVVLILTVYKRKANEKTRILQVFIFAVSFASLLLILIAVYRIIQGNGVSDIVFHDFTAPLDQHPVYFSLYIGLALILFLFYDKIQIGSRSLYRFILIPVLSIALILAASKAVIIALLFLITISGVVKFKKKKPRAIIAMSVIAILIAVLAIPFLRDRFAEGLSFSNEVHHFSPSAQFADKKEFTYEEKMAISDLDLRVLMVKIGVFHLVSDGKLWFGYGAGDTQANLNFHYFSYDLGPNWFEDFNVHNQYLDFLLNNGLLFTLIFLSYMAYSFRVAWEQRNLVYLNFLLLIAFVFLFESLLVRNKGIVFFYFFNTLFLLNYNYFENRNIRN